MDAKQLHILQHSLGLNEYGRGTMYRDHFVTGEGSIDHPTCLELTELGFMTRRKNVEMCGGDDVFRVTSAGKHAAVASSPKPPKLTRGQQRYRDWLNADNGMTFGEYLRWISVSEDIRRGYR
jgi:hypothetical protein